MNAGTDEFYIPGNSHVNVVDRDSGGNAIGFSNNGSGTAFSVDYSLIGQNQQSNFYLQFSSIAFGYPKADGLFLGWIPQSGTQSGTAVTPPLPDSMITISGGRTYDSGFGSWTTPDAYKGDVADPASMERYMWNGNDPVAYSDPSGFCADSDKILGFCNGIGLVLTVGASVQGGISHKTSGAKGFADGVGLFDGDKVKELVGFLSASAIEPGGLNNLLGAFIGGGFNLTLTNSSSFDDYTKMKLTRFRGVCSAYGERVHHGQAPAASLPAGISA